MTAPLDGPALSLSLRTVVMFAFAALAWAGVIAYARNAGNGPGTMGLSAREFVPMWSLMMTAMMLPAVAPVASLYVRTIRSDRPRRLLSFLAGYLIVWSAVGVPVYVVLRVVDAHVADSAVTMRALAVALLVAAGVYQLTPVKAVCLRHCRSPLGQLLRYGNVKGPARDLKVGLHHAGFCLGCCWALMALFVAFGLMNVWAMLGLAALVLSEKCLRRGESIGRAAGVAFVVLALGVAASSSIASAIVPSMADETPMMTHR